MSDPDEQSRDMNSTIKEGLKALEEFGFKDQSLWETFREKFEGDTEDDFKLATPYHLRKLRDFLRKYGVWVQKEPRIPISKTLYNVLQEEERTPWSEAEVKLCMAGGEEFDNGSIRWLLETDFGRNPPWQLQASPSQPLPTQPTPPPARLCLPIPPTLALPADIRIPSEAPELLPATATITSGQPAQSIQATTTATSGHRRELSNLTNMHTKEAKYSVENDSHLHFRAHKPNLFPKWLDRWSLRPSWQPASLRNPISKILFPFFRLSPRCPRHEHLHPLFPNGDNLNLHFS